MIDVIILGYNHHNALGLIRSLGEKGCRVHLLLLKSGLNFVNKSSYLCSWALLSSFDEVLQRVRKIADRCDRKPVLLVAGDGEATFVNQHFEEISKVCFVEGAYHDGDVVVYNNKFRSNELAKKFGFLIPKTWIVENAESIPDSLVFPLLVKAGESIRGGKSVLKKCDNIEELKTVLSSMPKNVFPLQVQEYINKDYEVIILGCSLNHGKEVICPVAERKLRYYPREYQTTAYTESLFIEDDPELVEITERIKEMIRKVGYTGMFSVELISARGKYYFLETNFRNDGTGYLATVCGYNLPYFLVQSFYGEKTDLSNYHYVPCHYVNVIADGMNVVHRKVPLFTWIKQLRQAKCYSHYSHNDKRPLLYAIIALFVNKMRR